MLASDAPTKVSVPFADSGDKRTVPVPSQVGITPGAASFTTGFPALTMTPISMGGIPPDGLDFNGVFNAITEIQQWQSAGGLFKYDAAFSAIIGGYPKGARLSFANDSDVWINTVENNITNPDTGGAGWVALSSNAGASLVRTIALGTGAVARSVQSALRDFVSVKGFGAVGDGVTDDTAAIQAAVTDVCTNRRGFLYFPPNDSGQFYKITAPIVIPSPIKMRGSGEETTTILGIGLSAGQHIFDFDCLAANVVENLELTDMTVRGQTTCNAIRMKNVSYFVMRNIRMYNVSKGVVVTGTRCYSNIFENVKGYNIGLRTISWEAFTGGGHYNFIGCTFTGTYGIYQDNTSNINQLGFVSCNFEACGTNSARIEGTVSGLGFLACRTEGCAGDDYVIYPSSGNKVTGINISGCYFTSNTAASYPVVLGGNTGSVRGFSIGGNTSNVGASVAFVRLNGDGESGVVNGNYFENATALPTSAQRAGVVVFGNENSAGKCAEYWGTSVWGVQSGTFTPVDASGAGLVFGAASGRYRKYGDLVFWHAYILFPTTANASNTNIGGLPFAVNKSTNSMGRGGASVSLSNVGSAVGVMQGEPTTSNFQFWNPTALTQITNVTLSAKQLYIEGWYVV